MPLYDDNKKQSVVKRWLGLPTLLAVFMAVGFTGCSSGEAPATESAGEAKSAPPQTANVVTTVAAVQRDIVRKASLSVRVADVGKAEKEVTGYVASIGGFVSNSESSNYDSTRPNVSMTVRVPVSKFDEALSRFESFGTRLHKNVSAEDVTGQLVDQQARLKTMLAQEESLRGILRASRRTADTIEVQQKLMELRSQIESLAAQRQALAGLASLSTIELSLVSEAKATPAAKDQDWLKESWTASTNQLASAFQAFGSMAVFVAVFSPLWLPPVLFFWWLIRRSTKKPVAQ